MAQQDVRLTLSNAPRESASLTNGEGAGEWSRRRADRRSRRESRRVASGSLPCASTASAELDVSLPTTGRKRSARNGRSLGPAKKARKSSINPPIEDCVAHRTRSKSLSSSEILKPSVSEEKPKLAEPSTTASLVRPGSSKTGHGFEGFLFPFDDRDFDYSPFSTSTATELVDSDHSLYSPNKSKTKNRRRKTKGGNPNAGSKRQRYDLSSPTTSISSIQAIKASAATRSNLTTRRPVARPTLVLKSSASSKLNKTYPLRNRSKNASSASEEHFRDSSVSSTGSEGSYSGRQLNISNIPSPLSARKAKNSQQSSSNFLLESKKYLVASKPSTLRSLSSKASTSNLVTRSGNRSTRAVAQSSPSVTQQSKRQSRASAPTGGECDRLRRSTRSAGASGVLDMPQQTQSSTAANNNKRDKKGKSSLGSCASSGGSSAGGRRPPPTPSVPSQANPCLSVPQQPPLSPSAVASTSNQQGGLLANMVGGINADSKSKFKGPTEENSTGMAENAAGGGTASVGESSSDDSEVGRLQALLEARGLPPHLLGALGPRMQNLIHRSMGATTSSKATQLLVGLQATGDEGQQLQAVIEMCQLLVMGNEDTLAGFPVRQVVPALITLLGMEHNFDMMNHACRALTYMMEALPHTSGAVALAVPVFLDKLQAITCMDVAEQSLTALDMLSRRHSKPILQARGISACLMYLDFFSINAQRAALSITSNCCLNLQSDEFLFIKESLPLLASRLTQQDKKSLESVCLAFSRLVDSYQNDPVRLQEIASSELLTNLQQLLVVAPPIISTGTFNTVLRMLSIMCSNCPELAIALLRQNIADTLLFLLTGSTVPNPQDEVELTVRSPPELYEITSLIAELMPHLPNSGLFTVDACLERPWGATNPPDNLAQWQWRDDSGVWRSYAAVDSRVIEAAHQNSEDEVSLNALGRTYIVDFMSMKQINEDTGTTRPVQRRLGPSPAQSPASPSSVTDASNAANANTTVGRWSNASDARTACLSGACGKRVLALSSVLLEVYSSSAGPAVRCQCLKALLRMVYHADTDMLASILKYQVVSSHIAGMMASNDLRIVVGSLQMAEILMQKLPDVFGVHFRREGVMHQIQLLADPAVPLCPSPPKSIRNLTSNTISSASVKRDLTSGMALNTLIHYSTNAKAKLSSNAANKAPATLANAVAPSVVNTNGAPGTSNATSLNYSVFSLETSQTSSNPNGVAGSLESVHSSNEIPVSSVSVISSHQEHRSQSPVSMRITDVLKRKRAPKRSVERATMTAASGTAVGNRHRRQEDPTEMPSAQYHHHPGSGFKLKFGGATSKTSSFLASLNPARWGRQHGSSSLGAITRETVQSNANIAAQNREKARQWVRSEAATLIAEHGSANGGRGGGAHPASGVLARLTAAVQRLRAPDTELMQMALIQLRDVLVDSDISPFEVNHSGLIGALLGFLTTCNEEDPDELASRNARLRAFLNVFADMPQDVDAVEPMFNYNPSSLSALVNKINACISQLEQFPVRVHDLPARPSTSALKFFNTHQLKCNLQRHPACTNLKQWKGGTVKIDPLALVYAIEKYLLVRGYARQRETNVACAGNTSGQSTHTGSHQLAPDSDDDNTEEDIDDSLAAVVISQGRSKHKLQFLIGENILPYNMTVYQAVRQFSPHANDQSETDTDTETPLGNAGIWIQTHTIYYRALGADGGVSATNALTGPNSAVGQGQQGRKGKGTSTKSNNRRKTDDLWNEGIVPPITSALGKLLDPKLPNVVTVSDASLSALALLRSLHAICRHWSCLYRACPQLSRSLLPQSDFVNSKLAAKASRQLQDPLVIMTGNLPQWLQQIAYACPFLFPLETRQLLFYAVSFDRDRALQRLLDSSPELNHASNDSTERVTPRLDRRKRTISRDHILKQAEQVIQDFAHSKALLEVKYENEVGTGLGPTLEFYALVSQELQRADLDLWHGSENFKQKPSSFGGDAIKSNQITVKQDPDSPPNIDPAANLASSVYNNLNLSEEHTPNSQNANVDDSSMRTVDMPTIVSSDMNLNSEIAPQGEDVMPPADDIKDHVKTSSEISYVSLPCGLFPQALGRNTRVSQLSKIKAKFRFLGKFMAKAVMDSRMLDLPFSLTFYRWIIGEEGYLTLGDIRNVAPELWRSLCRLQRVALHADNIRKDSTISSERKREMLDALELDGCPIEELGLDFILPGHSCTELRRGGRDLAVTSHNLGQYISLVTHWLLFEGVNRQMEAFREGFESVFPLQNLKMFFPEELEAIFCGTATGYAGGISQRWDIRMLSEACRADHGFTSESRAIRMLLEILSLYDTNEQRLFLQFLTGSPRLPTGGFKSLSPPLTVVRKTLESNVNADDYLPSVMTCVNYLKLPDYSTIEVMRTKLRIAASEGQHSFHLS